ncbi:class D sortase [Pseudoflavonifractor phocaeensis]|uniref:class D sortase n=1 Tax=Pseudoflavonifractor phocaeensis TaxID=1870988 RepID=UPI00210875C3|nr:sortase [Pseudoflavonifractor phocaeensis]MCQ4863551.1 class D sortase [Pseudoflavonifractor phocaeensis]
MVSRFFPALALAAALLTAQAGALEYTVEAPEGGSFGKPTSVEVVEVVGGETNSNEDRSKNAALSPPAFGSPTGNLPGSGAFLTPDLAPGGRTVSGTVSGTGAVILPPADTDSAPGQAPGAGVQPVLAFTEVTSDIYYTAGHLGTLNIPAIGLTVKVYEGIGSATLSKGAGHFAESSIWDGNVCVCAHNRGVNAHFGQLHTLSTGDRMTLTTRLGTRTYEVVSVSKVSETDRSGLEPSADNQLTLYTCVRNQSEYRWCVRGVEVVR